MINSAKVSEYAASFVDAKLQVLANTLDGTAGAFQATSAIPGSSAIADKITMPLKSRLEKTAQSIRSKQGADVVEAAKNTIIKNPAAAVGLGAAAGALLVQVAIVAIKAERKEIKRVKMAEPKKAKAV